MFLVVLMSPPVVNIPVEIISPVLFIPLTSKFPVAVMFPVDNTLQVTPRFVVTELASMLLFEVILPITSTAPPNVVFWLTVKLLVVILSKLIDKPVKSIPLAIVMFSTSIVLALIWFGTVKLPSFVRLKILVAPLFTSKLPTLSRLNMFALVSASLPLPITKAPFETALLNLPIMVSYALSEFNPWPNKFV